MTDNGNNVTRLTEQSLEVPSPPFCSLPLLDGSWTNGRTLNSPKKFSVFRYSSPEGNFIEVRTSESSATMVKKSPSRTHNIRNIKFMKL